jgi:hypothetical protein
MNGMINFSYIPLRIGLFIGLISIFSGLLLLSYQIYDYFVHAAYYHLYKWLVVVIFIFIGFVFMILWMIGEYIARIYDEVRDRPIYIIDKTRNI